MKCIVDQIRLFAKSSMLSFTFALLLCLALSLGPVSGASAEPEIAPPAAPVVKCLEEGPGVGAANFWFVPCKSSLVFLEYESIMMVNALNWSTGESFQFNITYYYASRTYDIHVITVDGLEEKAVCQTLEPGSVVEHFVKLYMGKPQD